MIRFNEKPWYVVEEQEEGRNQSLFLYLDLAGISGRNVFNSVTPGPKKPVSQVTIDAVLTLGEFPLTSSLRE